MFTSKEGSQIPNVVFHTRWDSEWRDISTDEIFTGRTVVVFALPGAFTPTCSSSHVPRYNELAPMFRQHGVDEIVCVSVNDAFVMNQWRDDQKADQITFLPDGNCDFTRQMGMLVSKDNLGFGHRSWRYSMLVRDKVIEKMFIEPDEPGDPFHVSDAVTMLKHINPDAELPLDVAIFTRKGCPYCARAKALLLEHGITYEELVLTTDFTGRALRAIVQSESYPQVFINGTRVGGAEELEVWLKGALREGDKAA
jgi:glutaredoxin-like protein